MFPLRDHVGVSVAGEVFPCTNTGKAAIGQVWLCGAKGMFVRSMGFSMIGRAKNRIFPSSADRSPVTSWREKLRTVVSVLRTCACGGRRRTILGSIARFRVLQYSVLSCF